MLETGPADGAVLELGRSWLTWGSAWRRAGQRRRARAPLQQAHQLFSAAGAAGWEARVALELRACGESVLSSGALPVIHLTPQELRVAMLVTQGARNREVANALFVSEKTVETHLGAVFRKLGIRSRAELGRQLGTVASATQAPAR